MSRSVFFVTPTLFPLGNSGQLEHWCGILAAMGWRVSVGVLHGQPNPDHQLRFPGVELKWLGIGRREWSGWARLATAVREQSPTVLHLWDCSESVYWATRRFKGSRVETVFNFEELPAWRWRAPRLSPCEWRLLYDPSLLNEVESASDAEATQPMPSKSGTVLLTRGSHFAGLRRPAERERIVHKAPLTIHEPREVTRGKLRKELGLPNEAKLIVGSAVFRPDTDCKDLIWGIDQLKIIRDDPHLLLLGTGPQLGKLQRFLSLTEVESNTHFLGERADGPEIVAAADLFWQADLTVFQPEGLLLALVHGVPSVSAYGAGTCDLVLPQQTAWVARPAARYEYARWSKYFLEEQQRTSQLSAQAREYATSKFPLQRLEQEVSEVYASFR